MGIFEEDRNLKNGKKDWMKLFESKQPEIKIPKDGNPEELDMDIDPDEEENSEIDMGESVASTGVAVVPHRMDLSEEDLNRLDEKTRKKLDTVMNRYSKMKDQMAELEEEMSYLKEMGQKQQMLDEMKCQIASVKDEITQLKEEKEKPAKKKVDPKLEDETEEDPEDGDEKEPKEEKSSKTNDDPKEVLKESYNKTMHKHGKVPGDAKFVDTLDIKNKKKRLLEGAYQKYLKNKTNAKDSGEEPESFSIVMG